MKRQMIRLGSWPQVLPLVSKDVVIQLSSSLTLSILGQGTCQVAEGGPCQQQRWRRRVQREWDPAEWDSRECRDCAWKPREVKQTLILRIGGVRPVKKPGLEPKVSSLWTMTLWLPDMEQDR